MVRKTGLLGFLLLVLSSCDFFSGGNDGPMDDLRISPNPVDFRTLGGGGSIDVSFFNTTDDTIRVTNLSVDNEALRINSSPFEVSPQQTVSRSLTLDFSEFDGRDNSGALFVEAQDYDTREIIVYFPFKRFKVNLSDHPSNNYPVALSPNGEHALYYSDRGGGYDIFLVNTEFGTINRLTDDPHQNIPVGFGSETDFILMYSDRNGAFDIFKLDTDGEITPLVESEYDDIPVKVYDNDQELLYYRDSNGPVSARRYTISSGRDQELVSGPYQPELYIEEHNMVVLTGGEEDELAYKVPPQGGSADSLVTFRNDQDVSRLIPVDYHPELDRIVAYSDLDFRRAVYTFAPDGSSFQQVVNSPRNDFPVAFTPDGSHIFFESNRMGNKDAFMYDLSSEEEEKITTSDYDDIPIDIGPDSELILFQSNREKVEGSRYHQVFITTF